MIYWEEVLFFGVLLHKSMEKVIASKAEIRVRLMICCEEVPFFQVWLIIHQEEVLFFRVLLHKSMEEVIASNV